MFGGLKLQNLRFFTLEKINTSIQSKVQSLVRNCTNSANLPWMINYKVVWSQRDESNLKKPGLLSGYACSRAYAFQLRPVCIITQSLMHAAASESLADFGTNENEHYKLAADFFFLGVRWITCVHLWRLPSSSKRSRMSFSLECLFPHSHQIQMALSCSV